jgi:hypothetical protein
MRFNGMIGKNICLPVFGFGNSIELLPNGRVKEEVNT